MFCIDVTPFNQSEDFIYYHSTGELVAFVFKLINYVLTSIGLFLFIPNLLFVLQGEI